MSTQVGSIDERHNHSTEYCYTNFIYNNETALLRRLLLIRHAPDDVRIAWGEKG